MDNTDKQHFVEVLREVLRADDVDAPLLIKRVPFICEDIRTIKRILWYIGLGIAGSMLTLGGIIFTVGQQWGAVVTQVQVNKEAIQDAATKEDVAAMQKQLTQIYQILTTK